MSLEDNPADDRYQLDQCIDEIKSLQSQIATITAERDQWKKQCESECQYGYLRQDELDAVKAELAALKFAPGMAEVDDILTPWVGQPFKSIVDDFEEMRTVARRSISSREEVVGMLKEAAGYSDGRLESRAESGDPVAIRIIEIVEGK